jgi:hypothetical protein
MKLSSKRIFLLAILAFALLVLKNTYLLLRKTKISYEITSNSSKPYQLYLIAVTMVKNKARYLPEWVEFHLAQGFDRFIIYNNNKEEDLTSEVLRPYINLGVVELIKCLMLLI